MSDLTSLLQQRLIPLDRPPQLPGWNHARITLSGTRITRHAAVLIGIREDSHQSIIFTRRQDHLADHAGQVAFPGGGVDAAKDHNRVDTALRESWEEISLDPDLVQPVGFLECFETISCFGVTPVVARINSQATLAANQDEVADVFEVPFAFFQDPSNLVPRIIERNGHAYKLAEFHYDGFRIWGATAAILLNFLYRIGQTWTRPYL